MDSYKALGLGGELTLVGPLSTLCLGQQFPKKHKDALMLLMLSLERADRNQRSKTVTLFSSNVARLTIWKTTLSFSLSQVLNITRSSGATKSTVSSTSDKHTRKEKICLYRQLPACIMKSNN